MEKTDIPDPRVARVGVVLLSRRGLDSLTAQHQRWLAEWAEVRAYPGRRPPTPARAVELLAPAEVLATTNACLPVLDDALLSQLPRLRAVVLFATGHDALDPVVLRRHGVELIAVPDYATASVAEHALALLLALTSRWHLANDRSLGRTPSDVSLRGVEVCGRTACVIGLGRIGLYVAGLLSALGARVLGCDPDPMARQRAVAIGVESADLETALPVAELVVVAAARGFAAPPLLGRDQLGLLPAQAFLVNVGRRELVDQPAVLAALRDDRLRGYAVDDVVAGPGSAVVDELARTGRLLQSGHSAWWTDEALRRGTRQWGERIVAVVQDAGLDLASRPTEVG